MHFLSRSLQIASVISFCTQDFRFLKTCIEGVQNFSSQVIVTVSDHFFDGKEEDYALLEELYSNFPDVTFIEFGYDPNTSYHYTSLLSLDDPNFRHQWHNTGRWISYFFLKKEIEYIYFSDVDEIVNGEAFNQWLEHTDLENYCAWRFASFWYFREAKFQATTYDPISLLVKKASLKPDMLWNPHERTGIYLEMQGQKLPDVKGLNGEPMVHHYSWVRTQEEMKRKMASWGHYWERDWQKLIEEEYARPFNGVDFVRKYTYAIVENSFDPLQLDIPVLSPVSKEEHYERLSRFKNVIRVEREAMFKCALVHEFQIEFSVNIELGAYVYR